MNLDKSVVTCATPSAKQISQAVSQVSLSKRSLIKNGWAIPLIVCVSLPNSGFAQNISGKPKPKPRPGQ